MANSARARKDIDRLPADHDAELGVIHRALMNPEEAPTLLEQVPSGLFYSSTNKAAMNLIEQLAREGQPITPGALREGLRTKLSESQIAKLLADALGAEEVLGLSLGGVENAVLRIHDTAHRRERMAAVEQLWNVSNSGNGDFGNALRRLNEIEERDPNQPIPWLDRPRKSRAIRSTELVEMDIPEPEELVFPMLVIKEGVSLISGPSKVGKSILVLNLAHAMISGEQFLRCHPVQKSSAMYLQTEMGASAVQKRIKQLSIVSDKLWVRNVEPGEFKLNTVRKGDYGRREKTPHRDKLVSLIQDLREKEIDCLIVDPIYELLDGSELDEFAMKSLFESLKAIARYTPCAVVAVHHTKKRREGDWVGPELSSGHNVLTRAPDALLTVIQQPRADDTHQYQLRYTLRHGPEPPPAELVRDGGHESLRWRACPWVGGGEGLHAVLDVLLEADGPMSASAIQKETGKSKATVYREIKRLVTAGRAKNVDGFYVVEGGKS